VIEILNIDCMEYMKGLEDNAFELAIVDPPYGMHEMGAQKGGNSLEFKHAVFKNGAIDKWDIAPKKEYFKELIRTSKNQIIWGGNYFDLPPSRCVICWDKVQSCKNFSQWEMGWTSFCGVAPIFRLNNKTGGRIHPTQKPVKLYEWLLGRYAKEGDRILDTHLGSGSSAIAAHYGGFDFVGCELDEDYYNAAKARFDVETAQEALF